MISTMFKSIARKRQARRNDQLANAIYFSDSGAVAVHLAKQANPNGLVFGRHYMLGYAINQTNEIKVYELLIAAGADVSKPILNRYGGQSRVSDAAYDAGRSAEIVALLRSAEQRHEREVGPLPALLPGRSCPIKKNR